jgi:hypothetical protein
MATRRNLMLTAAAFAGATLPIPALAKTRALPAKAQPLPLVVGAPAAVADTRPP